MRGRVVIDGITHRVYAVNDVGIGGTACGAGFSQRPNAAQRNMAFGQRTSHEAAVNCMACIAEGTGEPTGTPPPQRLKNKPWWLVLSNPARKLR
jgi:hypothetical protein